jgi:uracil permease
VVENQVDFTKSRNVLIAAMILVLAIGLKYGTGTVGGITFMLGNVNIMLSGLSIAALVGIAMNAILPGKDYEFGVNHQGDTSVNFGSRQD